MNHVVKIFKIGWCYLSVCSCGRKFQWQDTRRVGAVNTSLDHIECRGSMAEDDAWVLGDETTEREVVKGWETPVLALIVVRGMTSLPRRGAVASTRPPRRLLNW